ncbi:hypothetical protein SeLEV6574_g06313 [Synchytrium endobioticum]|uniref:Integrase catalytic domain-containing protein n=1 Tax=Synchytrium endobioticum TaxID=286115 RepID=A0A507CPA6_9FUNG|nr:hypothetical protein SeLEV6574_g06313 [Synchytrium endobioticum]
MFTIQPEKPKDSSMYMAKPSLAPKPFANYLDGPDFSDAIIEVIRPGGNSVNIFISKLTVADSSPVFLKVFQAGMSETKSSRITISDVSEASVRAMVEFAYTNAVSTKRSKSILLVPTTESISADETAKLVFHRVICKHGVPASITSDRGPQFRSRFWKSLFDMLGTNVTLSSAYPPETDGQSERVNQEIDAYLRCFTSYNQDHWTTLLPQADFAHNNSHHSSMGMSPFFAATGQNASLGSLLCEPVSPSNVPEANRIREHFANVQRQLRAHLETARDRYKHVCKHVTV